MMLSKENLREIMADFKFILKLFPALEIKLTKKFLSTYHLKK